MGNSMTIEQKAREMEKRLLSLSGLEIDKDLHILEVKIDFLGENFIHTIKCGEENESIMVLLHGYGGTSVLFYQMLKELSKTHQVFCPDLLGMGLSSRPEFNCTTTEET